MSMEPGYLFAALLWGSIGLGFFIYGKKRKSPVHLIGGILLMGITYIVRTAGYLSLVSIAIIAGIYVTRKMM